MSSSTTRIAQTHLPADRPLAEPKRLRLWQRWVKRASEEWVVTQLAEIDSQRQHLADRPEYQANPLPTWILQHRDFFRSVEERRATQAVHLYLQDCPWEMIPLAVWLLSRCANRFDLCGLPEYVASSNPQVQRVVARTFYRCEAWGHLETLARRRPDSRTIAWYAGIAGHAKPLAERLRNWNRHVARQPLASSSTNRELWFRDWPWTLTPPKSAAVIRRVLRRIRWLVRLKSPHG